MSRSKAALDGGLLRSFIESDGAATVPIPGTLQQWRVEDGAVIG